ncbi:glycosyltransferase family 39 protein [Patescibacteria group bacterium]|nr:glycosyltransferase family 39 protein [Patescibacteria group bacterium]
MKILQKYFFFVFNLGIVFVNLILVIIWFHKGTFLATGESALPFYNPSREFLRIQHTWGLTFLGNYIGYGLSDYFYYGFLSILQGLSIPTNLIQALVFFFFLNSIYFSFYLLSGLFIEDRRIRIISSLFYSFNLFSMVTVWGRFQYTYMFFYAFLPLGLYLFIKGLKTYNYKYGALLALTSIVFAEMFASVPLFLLFWGVIFLYLIYFIFNKRKLWFPIKFFIFTVFLFLIFHSFWILPFVQTIFSTSYITTKGYSPAGDFQTFQILSKTLGNFSYIVRLMNEPFFVNKKSLIWGGIYFNPVFILLSFLVPILVFASLLVKKYVKNITFFIILIVISLFFVEGDNQPLGFISDFLFTHFRVFEAFRNPFEKIGFLLPFAFAIPFSITLVCLYDVLSRLIGRYRAEFFLVFFCFLIIVVLPFPIWNGWIFSKPTYAGVTNVSKEVQVPVFYKEANNWLSRQNDLRTIAFPLGGEGMTYTWPKAYSGVELSNTLFSRPFLSIDTSVPYASNLIPDIENLFVEYPNDFWKALPLLGADKVMVREDVNKDIERLRDPSFFAKQFSTGVKNFSFADRFGPLAFYSLSKQKGLGRIYASDNIALTSGGDSFLDFIPAVAYKKGLIFIDDKTNRINLPGLIHQTAVKGKKIEQKGLKITKDNALAGLPSSLFLPSSPLYFLPSLKYNILKDITPQSRIGNFYLTESGKRITDLYRLTQENNFNYTDSLISQYNTYLDYFYNNMGYFNSSFKYEMLERQKIILEEIVTSSQVSYKDIIEKSYRKLVDLLVNLGVMSKYSSINNQQDYLLNVPVSGDYELRIVKNDFIDPTAVTKSNIVFYVDGVLKKERPLDNGKFISFGTLNFAKGRHEISFIFPDSANTLFKENRKITISAAKSKKVLSFPIKAVDTSAAYAISFDYRILKGKTPPVLQFAQDTDPLNDKGFKEPESDVVQPALDNFEWNTYRFSAVPFSRSQRAYFKIVVSPYNDCQNQYMQGLIKIMLQDCGNKQFRDQFNLETKLSVKNIKIQKDPYYDVYLVRTASGNIPKNSSLKISYHRINPAVYTVQVRNAKSPFVLVFSDSFHDLWNASLIDENGSVGKNIPLREHFLANSYANAWYIDKTGNYSIRLEFGEEKYLRFEELISFGSILIVAVSIILISRRKND